MIALTYLSTAVDELDQGELEEFLTVWRRSNESREITGVLLYAGGKFIQTIEGDPVAVDELYATIQGDRRHRAVRVMLREKVRERSFGEWSMGFQRLADEEADELPGFNEFLESETGQRYRSLKHSRAAIYYRMFTNGPW